MSKLHISQNGEAPVEYPESEVQSMFRQGLIQDDAIYWKEGMSDWQPLRALFPPPAPVSVVAPPPLVAPLSPYAPPAVNPVPPPVELPPGRYAFTKDPRGLTKVLQVMLWLYALVVLLSIASDFGQLHLANGGEISQEAADANDSRQGLVGILYLGSYFATVIVFGMWIYRANLNCRGFGAARMEFTPGWSVGYYFVPILNLFRPFQAMREIWKVSSNPRHWPTEAVPSLLGWWWGLWIVGNLLGQIVYRVSKEVDSVDSLRTATVVMIASSLVDIFLTIAAFTMISRIIAMQVRLTEGKA